MDIKWMRRVSNQTVFPLKVYKWSVLNWEEKKKKLLDLVDFSEEDKTSLSPFTDFHKSAGRPSYFNQWYEILRDDLKEAFEEPVSIWQDQSNPGFNLKYGEKDTWRLWTQRYRKGQSHPPHNHGVGFISAVLYLEFDPEEHFPTKLYSPYPDTFSGTIPSYMPSAQEGDIFVFPSILLHDSPVTMSDKPKTIQAFNVPLIFPGEGPVSPRDQLANLNDTSQDS
jgi:hypothetical protein